VICLGDKAIELKPPGSTHAYLELLHRFILREWFINLPTTNILFHRVLEIRLYMDDLFEHYRENSRIMRWCNHVTVLKRLPRLAILERRMRFIGDLDSKKFCHIWQKRCTENITRDISRWCIALFQSQSIRITTELQSEWSFRKSLRFSTTWAFQNLLYIEN